MTTTSSPTFINHLPRLSTSLLGAALLLSLSGSYVTQAQGSKPPDSATAKPRSEWVRLPIAFGKLQPYTHPTQWFQAQLPSNWNVKDTSTDANAITTFSDPTNNCGIVFRVFGSAAELTKQQMATKLDAYIHKAFDHFTRFTASGAKPNKTTNGAVQGFSYEQKLANNKTVTIDGDAFYRQDGDGGVLTSIIILLLPEEQYITVKDKAYKVVDSFTPRPENYTSPSQSTSTPTASNATSAGAFEFGDLTNYKEKSGTFQLRVPSAWTRTEGVSNKIPFVVWADQTGLSLITVVSTPLTTTFTSAELRTAATAFIKGYASSSKSMSKLIVGTTRIVDTSSASADFSFESYVKGDSIGKSATVLVRQAGKTAVFILVDVPNAELDASSDAIKEILDSLVVFDLSQR